MDVNLERTQASRAQMRELSQFIEINKDDAVALMRTPQSSGSLAGLLAFLRAGFVERTEASRSEMRELSRFIDDNEDDAVAIRAEMERCQQAQLDAGVEPGESRGRICGVAATKVATSAADPWHEFCQVFNLA